MDSEIVQWLNSGVGRFGWWDALMRAVVSDYLVPVLGGLVLLAFWFGGKGPERVRNQVVTIVGAGAIGLANLATSHVNRAYFRARPFVDLDLNVLFYQPTDSSFPSNAPALAFAVATAVFLAHRRLGVAMYGIAFLYGFARVYSGLHYPTDTLAGAAIGITAAMLVCALTRIFHPLVRLFLWMVRATHMA